MSWGKLVFVFSLFLCFALSHGALRAKTQPESRKMTDTERFLQLAADGATLYDFVYEYDRRLVLWEVLRTKWCVAYCRHLCRSTDLVKSPNFEIDYCRDDCLDDCEDFYDDKWDGEMVDADRNAFYFRYKHVHGT